MNLKYFFLCLVLGLNLSNSCYGYCKPNPKSVEDSNTFGFPIKLHLQKDYYRSTTEILKLKFLFPKESARHRLDLYLIKNYYELKDYARAVDISNDFLGKHSKSGSSPSTREAGYYLTLSLLAQGKDEQAGKTWNIHVRQRSIDRFPTMRDIPDRVDPEKARLYSKMVPGSGLLLSGEYGKAAVSFLINLVFIAGSYRYFVGKQYGTAGLLFFFEIGWYHGGQNASHEAAVRYNERSTRQYRKDWLRSRMPPTGM